MLQDRICNAYSSRSMFDICYILSNMVIDHLNEEYSSSLSMGRDHKVQMVQDQKNRGQNFKKTSILKVGSSLGLIWIIIHLQVWSRAIRKDMWWAGYCNHTWQNQASCRPNMQRRVWNIIFSVTWNGKPPILAPTHPLIWCEKSMMLWTSYWHHNQGCS